MYRLTLALLAVLLVPAFAQATTSLKTKENYACGGQIITHSSCDKKSRERWEVTCCDQGYRAQGISFSKHTHSNRKIDAMAVECRSVQKGNVVSTSKDFGRESRLQHTCKTSEILTGVAFKQHVERDGDLNDALSAAAPICLHPGNGKIRTINDMNMNTLSSPRQEVSVKIDKMVIGIATLDEDVGDDTECVGLVVIDRPSFNK